jgi:hypothetical protein
MSDEELKGDPAIVAERAREIYEAYDKAIATGVEICAKAVEQNKHISAFQERLLLLALGTVGLSVTALVSLSTKFETPVARSAFTHFVAPAWVLLLVSSWASRNAMAYLIRLNNAILKNVERETRRCDVNRMKRALTRMEGAAKGKIVVEDKVQDISAVLRDAVKSLEEMTSDNHEALKSETEADSKRLRRVSRIGVWAFQLGLVLLCIAAIKLVLQ